MLCLLLLLAGDAKAALSKPLLSPRQAMLDVQDHVEAKLPALPAPKEGWAKKLRADLLSKIVLRGEAAKWDAKGVEYGDTLEGVGYSIRKLRYEVLPGMWVPALLYVPAKLADKTPVMLAVNGHDRNGKAADYKQIRCINLAKRGMLVLNAEWFGMGQLREKGWEHGAMNQLDLCGTAGLAPFYLSMKRGLDVLMAQPKADPARVAVSGLSGGGWQTIWISALDERVTLANPVAGYSPFKVKIRDWFKDLGDSEQTPTDFATLADYTHLTAMRAPRPTLLTYNSKDACCFEAGYALPPLLKAARPFYEWHKKAGNLRSHVNDDPGDHNFGKDNREALYRAVGDHFYPDDKAFVRTEIECAKEVRKPAELEVGLPKGNRSLNALALDLSGKLTQPLPKADAGSWQLAKGKELAEILRFPSLDAKTAASSRSGDVRHAVLRLSGKWSVPVTELSPKEPKGTCLVLNDGGRAASAAMCERLLKEGYRVVAADPWYFGENKVQSHDWLFALLMACFGDRALGLQAAQVGAVARWAEGQHGGPVHVVAVGPRMSLIALCAAAMEKGIASVELHGSRASLRELLQENRAVAFAPEMFCFGLMEKADVLHLAAMTAPRPVRFIEAKEQHKKELASLKRWYELLGKPHDPLE